MPTAGRRLAAAVIAVAAALLGLTTTAQPSQALAGCPGSAGVVVVVDFQSLGGGAQQACVADGGGKSAVELFTAAGFNLTYVATQPGFVCRVSGAPANASCASTPPADAYWGLFVSDGRNGTWNYASSGAGSLTVPDGGYVGFAWQSGTRVTPGIAPTVRVSEMPTPTPPPSSEPSVAPTAQPSPSPTTRPSNPPAPTKKPAPTKAPSKAPTKSPDPTATTSANPTASTQPSQTPAPTDSAGTAESAQPSESTDASPSPATNSSKTAKPKGKKSGQDDGAAASEPANPEATTVADTSVEADSGGVSAADNGLPLWVVLLVLGFLGLGGIGVILVRSRRAP